MSATMNDRLLDKMQKLLALRDRAGTEGEAQAAAIQLQRLLTEHNLSVADLEKKGAKAPEAVEQGHDLGKAAFRWKLDLAKGVAEFFYCVSLVYNKTVRFVGRPDNVESLKMTYSWLIQQIAMVAREERTRHHERTGEHIDPLRWQVNFGIGAVERLIQRLSDEKADLAEEMARNDIGDVVAVTVSHAREANDYLEKNYGFRRDGQYTQSERESIERYNKQQKAKQELKERDIDAYYRQYPWEHPDQVAARAAEYAKTCEEREKREEKNAKRRAKNQSQDRNYRFRSYESEEKEERRYNEAREARSSGRDAAGRINLHPFLKPGSAGKPIKE